MPLQTYQQDSRKTYVLTDELHPIAFLALGLTEEAGEAAGKIKKVFRDNNGNFDAKRTEQLKHELGDVLWYLTQLCTELGLTLEDVAEANLQKTLSRLQRNKIDGSGDHR